MFKSGLLGIYKPPAQNDLSFLNEVKITLTLHSKSYHNFLVVEDFNMSPNNSNLKGFRNYLSSAGLTDNILYCRAQEPKKRDHTQGF